MRIYHYKSARNNEINRNISLINIFMNYLLFNRSVKNKQVTNELYIANLYFLIYQSSDNNNKN